MKKQTSFYFKTGRLIFGFSDRPCSKALSFIRRHSQSRFDRQFSKRLYHCENLLPYSYSVTNSADSRRSPANAAVLADIPGELTETVETVDSDLPDLSAGQGGNYFKLSEFKTGLYADWRRCVDHIQLPPFGRIAFDMYLSIDNPRFSRGLAFRNKYYGAPARYLWG